MDTVSILAGLFAIVYSVNDKSGSNRIGNEQVQLRMADLGRWWRPRRSGNIIPTLFCADLIHSCGYDGIARGMSVVGWHPGRWCGGPSGGRTEAMMERGRGSTVRVEGRARGIGIDLSDLCYSVLLSLVYWVRGLRVGNS